MFEYVLMSLVYKFCDFVFFIEGILYVTVG